MLLVFDPSAASSNGKFVTDLKGDDAAGGSQNIIDEDSNESTASKVFKQISALAGIEPATSQLTFEQANH